MPAPNALDPRKKPRQARSKCTVESILTAAARILVNSGYAKMTTTAVAELAGVSVGSLYQYFPGKDALVAALLEQYLERIAHTMERAAQPGGGNRSLEEDVEAQLRALLAAKMADPGLAVALKTQVPVREGFPNMRLHHARMEDLTRQSFERHRDAIAVADLDLAAFLVVSAVDGVLNAVIEQRPDLLGDDCLLEALARLVVAFLAAPRHGRTTPVPYVSDMGRD